MATTNKTAAPDEAGKTIAPVKPAEEKVLVSLIKDSENYKDDVFLCVNGKSIKIKRGVDVEIPKAHAEVLKNSMEQDGRTADLITKRTSEFENNKKSVGL